MASSAAPCKRCAKSTASRQTARTSSLSQTSRSTTTIGRSKPTGKSSLPTQQRPAPPNHLCSNKTNRCWTTTQPSPQNQQTAAARSPAAHLSKKRTAPTQWPLQRHQSKHHLPKMSKHRVSQAAACPQSTKKAHCSTRMTIKAHNEMVHPTLTNAHFCFEFGCKPMQGHDARRGVRAPLYLPCASFHELWTEQRLLGAP